MAWSQLDGGSEFLGFHDKRIGREQMRAGVKTNISGDDIDIEVHLPGAWNATHLFQWHISKCIELEEMTGHLST